MSDLPAGWSPARLGDVLTLVNGRAYKKHEMLTTGTPILRIQNLNSGNNWYYSELDLPEDKYANEGDLLYSWSATFGPYWCIWDKVIFHYHIWKVVPTTLIDKRFAYYELLRITEDIRNAAHGVAMPHMTKEGMENWEIILPPIDEQVRIAEKLDDLFERVKTLKHRIESIPSILKHFRQSVLTSAVNGKLTEEWRSVANKDWCYERADNVCAKVQSGGTPKEGFSESGIPFLKVYNIVNQKVDFDYRKQYISIKAHTGPSAKSIAYPGDVLMNIVGPPLGKIATIPETFPEWNTNQAITLFRPSERITSGWISIALEGGENLKNIENETKGSAGQVNISLSQCRSFIFPLPSVEEQIDIVRRVETLFFFADRLQKNIDNIKSRVHNLNRSILAKAFRGELTSDWRDANPELVSGKYSSAARLQKIKSESKHLTPKIKKVKTAIPKKAAPHMSKTIITVIEALKLENKSLTGQQLMAAAGYPNDSSTEQLESFFLDLREAMELQKIIKLSRDEHNQDWFTLSEEQ
jgi:Restriction endonuclease S subunits